MSTIQELCLEALELAAERIRNDESLDCFADTSTPELLLASRKASATTACMAMCKAMKFEAKEIGGALKHHEVIMAFSQLMGDTPVGEWPPEMVARIQKLVES